MWARGAGSGAGALGVPWGVLWRSRSPWALLVRAPLLLPAGAYLAAVSARNLAYDYGLCRVRRLARPAVGVGNLTVGGTGKTPLAGWIAKELSARGVKPAILLRGYGGDEELVHREAVPEALVVADPDRSRGATAAVSAGADVLVLDDAFQHRRVVTDLNMVLLSTEASEPPRWVMPAGPWREPLSALRRADGLIVTTRTSDAGRAERLAGRFAGRTRLRLAAVVELTVGALTPLAAAGGEVLPPQALAGEFVLAVAGIADPDAFARQLRDAGARVELLAGRDHQRYDAALVRRIAARAGLDRIVVTTLKDAVKLRPLWPADGPRCLVAHLEVRIRQGGAELAHALDGLAAAARLHLPSQE